MKSFVSNNRKKLLENINKIHRKSYYAQITSPKLIAVSKKQSDERIKEGLDANQRIFGENRIQEAENRWKKYLSIYEDLELHFIGRLQTNKVKSVLKMFKYIHSLDRESLALEIAKNLKLLQKENYFFIQVNTGEENQKSGILPKDLRDFYSLCTEDLKIPVIGLMCLPPINEEPSIHFCLLNKLSNELNLKQLSMGMSSDYEDAIRFGSTYLRIGTEFFGKRES